MISFKVDNDQGNWKEKNNFSKKFSHFNLV